ncbi:DAO-domain-containing protein [Corynespora cassiicola Philippines]|uniref:DAO-domain-containing protein n=1 Tax=Corynespora cassiicola Philippines TaxID=1448308 RepID=A0A2T2NKL3_CORCC|nr:DAO-domain-containing protein [Corynespora cassiicola Philippines]
MGALISTLQTTARGLKSIFGIISSLTTEFNAALVRASLSPGLPIPTPTSPYWLHDPPFPELTKIRSSEKEGGLPRVVDVAIIGSGIAGAAVARSLLHEQRRLRRRKNVVSEGSKEGGKVIVFEARDLCSGATARNGGHIKPTPYESFSRFSKMFGRERAAALTRFQTRHVECLVGLCEEEGIGVAEAREVETVDLYLDEESFWRSCAKVDEARRWIPEVETAVLNAKQAKKEVGVNDGVVGAIKYRAGAIWAYRFVVSIWKRLLDEFPDTLLVETNTPVLSLRASEGKAAGFPYAIETPRGTVLARHVVHATNAFASHLVPGLRLKITGVRGHMSAQRPGDKFPHSEGKRSWSVVYGGGFDYVSQRPSAPDHHAGDVMLGGGFMRSLKQGVDQAGLYDDGTKLDPLSVAHIAGIFPSIFSPNWGPGSHVKDVWTGILGMTGDSLPLVGRLDERLTGRKIKDTTSRHGEWIAAGYSGEGMVWAWLCGTALGIMVSGTEKEHLEEVPGRPGGKLADWLPRELLISPSRLRSADFSNLTDEV